MRRVFANDIPIIVKMYESGYTLDEVAVNFDVTRAIISKCLRRLKKTRTPEETKKIRGTIQSGDRNPCWGGGRWENSHGYIEIHNPSHYRANSHGYVLEHILVWEEYHKKKLPTGYLIHHLNGIKSDNRPTNLLAMRKDEHLHQAEPFKKRIRELEIENRQLKRALDNAQMIFCINEN